MTMTMVELSESLQAMIDSRLDTIDRILLGRMSRADRIAIVREVESQIHELLQEQTRGEPDREDILAVLARLDPPEAYIPEVSDRSPDLARRPSTVREPIVPRKIESGPARISGILGLIALVIALLSPISYFLAEAFHSEWPFLLVAGLAYPVVIVTAIIAITLAAVARLKSAWAIVGLITGILVFFLVILEVAAALRL